MTGERMILGSEVNHRIQKMDAMEREIRELKLKVNGLELIRGQQRVIIQNLITQRNLLKAELHRVDV